MPQSPIGSAVRNLFFLQHAGNAIAAEAEDLLSDLFDDIAAQIARLDPASIESRTVRVLRINALMAEIETITSSSFRQMKGLVTDRLVDVGVQQGNWASEQLDLWFGAALTNLAARVYYEPVVIGPDLIRSILENDPIQGLKLGEWFDGQQEGTVRKVRRQIQLGMAQNETIDEMIRRVRGRFAGKRGVYTGGVMETTTREAEAIVRTSVNFIANEAHFETYKANEDITEEYEYIATLDSRTTIICANLDGQVFRYDDPSAPRPPQHINCRSTIAPIIKWADLGVEPPAEGTRSSVDGQVRSSINYEQWLKDQAASVQEKVLGKTRARLFRDGKVDLRDMVRNDNTIILLDDLLKKAS